MSTSPEEPPTESSGAGEPVGVEPLACTCCRSRKLKCELSANVTPAPRHAPGTAGIRLRIRTPYSVYTPASVLTNTERFQVTDGNLSAPGVQRLGKNASIRSPGENLPSSGGMLKSLRKDSVGFRPLQYY